MQLLAGLGQATAPNGTPLELPEIALKPRCFQTRRLVRYRGSWYVFPNEEPRPSGDGEGGIVKSMGLDGFAEPRLLWQSSVPTSTGKDRKPVVIVPEATHLKDKAVPWAKQVAKARARTFENGAVSMDVPPVLAGSGSARRAYKRPVLRIKGERVPDRGKVVNQLEGGPVWWQSKQPTKGGALTAPRTLKPLTDEQVSAIEFQLWLEKHHPDPVERLLYLVREWKALVIVNHSGGKDSQAMYLHLTRDLGVPHDQIKVVHADLPGADWPGTLEHVQRNVDHDVEVVRAKFSDGAVKELYDYVLHRGKFPSAQQRYCTSDLKTSPINAWIRQALCEVNGLEKPCEVDPAAGGWSCPRWGCAPRRATTGRRSPNGSSMWGRVSRAASGSSTFRSTAGKPRRCSAQSSGTARTRSGSTAGRPPIGAGCSRRGRWTTGATRSPCSV